MGLVLFKGSVLLSVLALIYINYRFDEDCNTTELEKDSIENEIKNAKHKPISGLYGGF